MRQGGGEGPERSRVTKQRTNAKSNRSKCCGLAISIRRKIYAVKAVELGGRREIFVQS